MGVVDDYKNIKMSPALYFKLFNKHAQYFDLTFRKPKLEFIYLSDF